MKSRSRTLSCLQLSPLLCFFFFSALVRLSCLLLLFLPLLLPLPSSAPSCSFKKLCCFFMDLTAFSLLLLQFPSHCGMSKHPPPSLSLTHSLCLSHTHTHSPPPLSQMEEEVVGSGEPLPVGAARQETVISSSLLLLLLLLLRPSPPPPLPPPRCWDCHTALLGIGGGWGTSPASSLADQRRTGVAPSSI